MALKNILVACNNSRSARNAVDTALVMQAKFDTHITGLVAWEHSPTSGLMHGWVPEAIKKSILEGEKETCSVVKAAWEKAVSEGGCVPEKTHWIETFGNPNATVMTYARYFDLTLMGQASADDEGAPMVSDPDLVAMQSGRPLMVVPTDFDRQPISDRIVVAWDGRRAAARALADAVQFLEEVSLVTILTVGDPNPAEKDLQADIAIHLERHGIRTEHDNIRFKRSSNAAVGHAIVDYCDQHRPDVLVMGAYEHSKFREDHFGGVTNTVFKDMTIPVFMSH